MTGLFVCVTCSFSQIYKKKIEKGVSFSLQILAIGSLANKHPLFLLLLLYCHLSMKTF